MTIRAFYDDLSDWYHLIYADWDASVARQGTALASLIKEFWPGTRDVLDVAVGVGTQALGLAGHGYSMVGSDLSPQAVKRAVFEARRRGLFMSCYVADFQRLPLPPAAVALMICCDNSLPHLESPAAIRATLDEWYRCISAGGGCLLSMRDYGDPPPSGTVDVHPYGERSWNGQRYELRQVWRWHGARYDLSLEMRSVSAHSADPRVLTTSYLAISVAHVQRLMQEAGFERVQRLDARFFQPVLVGHKPRVT